jgi:membrane-associated phospholipid phosphatase
MDSVEDVPDISARWYLDIVTFAADCPPWLRELATVLTEALVAVFVVLFAALAWTRRTDPAALARALLAPVVTGVAYVVSELIKSGWQVDRPCREIMSIAACPEFGDWSFPSNHATIAGAAAVAVLWSSRALGALAVVVALMEAASRVFVGVHYPHDVLAGLLLGAAVAAPLPLLARAVTPLLHHTRAGARVT